MAPIKHRSFCFTINNPGQQSELSLRDLGRAVGTRYIVCGHERGANGTPHIQGFVYFKNPRSDSSVRRLPAFAHAHVESARGSPAQASDYCKKDGDFWEEGELPRAGRRSDLEEIKEEIEDGKSELYVAEQHFSQWCIYRKSFEKYRQLLVSKPRNWDSWTNVLVGPTGLGKTRYVYQLHKDDDIYVWGGDRWFDGYCGQRIALLDDFRGELTIGFMLRLLDRYPMQVPIKGGFVNWNPRRIYITSNHMPEHWWDTVDGPSLDALNRRINRLDSINTPIFD